MNGSECQWDCYPQQTNSRNLCVHIFSGPPYRTCEVYIDDLLFHCQDDKDFVQNAREIFQTCREKGVILSAKKSVIGMERVTFVGHDVDSEGLNMTEPRIASASIQDTRVIEGTHVIPGSSEEYFRDHIKNHSAHAHHLHDMVSAANKQIVKMITWTAAGRAAFTTLKELVNEFPKMYFIKKEYKIILYTDASDYAHGAYLCQVIPAAEGRAEYEEPIRFLSGSFHGAQTRWSTIEKEAYAIYWALGKLDDLLGGILFTRFIRTDHRNLLYMNNHESRKVLQWKLDIQHYDAIIEHVPGVMNTPANVFSRLVEKEMTSEVNHVMTLTCSVTQREIIKHHHEWLCDHNGVDRTLALMTQRYPEVTSTAQWPQLRHDVREYIQSCATCKKMEVRHKSIQASNFVDTKTNAAYCAGHGHGYLDGFQIHHCRHRHIYEVRGTLSRK